MSIGKRAAAEFFGTFWLVFGGCGSAVLAATLSAVGITIGIAIVVYGAVWLYGSPFYTLREATSAFFNSTMPNLLFALVILPLLLWVYDLLAWRGKKTR